MDKKYVKSLLLTAVCSAGAVLMAAEDSSLERSIHTTIDAFSVDKQQQEATANAFIGKGNDLFVAGDYKEAARNYAQAAYIFDQLDNTSEHFAERLEKTKELIAKCYYTLAKETALQAHEEANYSELENAIAYCKEAIAIYPACADEMNERIALYEKMRVAAVKRSKLTEGQVIPDMEDTKYRLAVLLKQARLLYYTKQYEAARDRYAEAVKIDKINPEAVQGMRACDLQIAKAGNERYRMVHKKALAEAAWRSVDPILKNNEIDARKELDLATISKKQTDADADETKPLRDKLNNIIIPRVNFSGDAKQPGTPLLVALDYLRMRSKAHDPEGQGVNIFLYFPEKRVTDELAGPDGMMMDPMGGMMAPAMPKAPKLAPLDPGAMMGPGIPAGSGMTAPGMGGGMMGGGMMGNDDFNFEDDFEDEEAETTEEGPDHSKYPLVNMDLVNKPLIDIIDALAHATGMKYKIEKYAVVLAPKDAALDDMQIKVFAFDDGLLDALGGDSDPEALKEALTMVPEANVEFPIGSKVMYDSKFRSLIVLNTPDNLDRINDALLDIRKQNPQPMVQVQVKFVEISQNDLKELGFIQSLGRPNGDNGKTNGRLQFDANETAGLTNSGRNTVTFSRSSDGYNYNLTVNAVNQLNSKDVLSSPKVLTTPGKMVSIKMTSERYFEWDYEEEDDDSNSGDGGVSTYSYTPPWPEFEKQELGITMEVTPTVDTEKRLIMLDVHPWVRTLVGWTSYEYTSSNNNSSSDGELSVMKRPIIAERTTDTNITLYNGETVVVGGMIKDYTVLVDDKIPFLGDIPLVGNLFKSKSSTIKKTNLLIFVTAQMLKPDGSPYYQTDSRGRPSAAGIGDVY